jgi:predicted metal-dependent phosphoesterase TrpH
MILKADFHLHTSDDPRDSVPHTSTELIDRAAELGFDVLAITNHDSITYSRELSEYAADRGILLIPGVEKTVRHYHVLILNAERSVLNIRTFEDLRAAKRDGCFIIAPHPFFRARNCLGRKLLKHIDLFDGIEYTFLYSRWLNLNRPAARVAEKYGLPLIGNSDSHVLTYFGRCHSLIEAESRDINSILTALRQRRVDIVAEPFGLLEMFRVYGRIANDMRLESKRRGLQPPEYGLRRRRRRRLSGVLVQLLTRS